MAELGFEVVLRPGVRLLIDGVESEDCTKKQRS